MESWTPTQILSSLNCEDEQLRGLRVHGWAEYETPLATDVAEHWDLLPADQAERAWYWLYRDVRNNACYKTREEARAAVLRYAERYREYAEEDLEWLSASDLWVARTLRAQPDSAPTFSGRYG